MGPQEIVERIGRRTARQARVGAALLLAGLVLALVWPHDHRLFVGVPIALGIAAGVSYRRYRRIAAHCADALACPPRSMQLVAVTDRRRMSLDLGDGLELDWGPCFEPGRWPPRVDFEARVWSTFVPGDPIVIAGDGRAIVGRVKAVGARSFPQKVDRFAAWCFAFVVAAMLVALVVR